MAEDGEIITSELNRSLATVDGFNMPIEERGPKQDGTRQLFHDDERDAVQVVAEPDSQQHLRRGFQHVTGSVAERGQFLVRGDEVLPSFGQGTPTDQIVSRACIPHDFRRGRGLRTKTKRRLHGVLQMCHEEALGGDLVIILVLGRPLMIAPLGLVLGGAPRRHTCAVVLLLTVFLGDDGVHQVYWRADENSWSKSSGRGHCATPTELSFSSSMLGSAAEFLPTLSLIHI